MKRLIQKNAMTLDEWLKSPDGQRVVQIVKEDMVIDTSRSENDRLSNIVRKLNNLGLKTSTGLSWTTATLMYVWKKIPKDQTYQGIPSKEQLKINWMNSLNGKKIIEVFDKHVQQNSPVMSTFVIIVKELNNLGLTTFSNRTWNYSTARDFWLKLQKLRDEGKIQ